MSVSFINPLFLFALAAGILPILIHRLTRRKALTKKFSAVRLLIQSQQNMARPQRIKHLFLLFLRILAVVTLVLLVARPILNQPGLLAMGREGATVIVFDNSASMGFRDEGGERFEAVKKAGKKIIQNLSGPVLVIPLVDAPGKSSEKREMPWVTGREAVQIIDEIPLSFGKGNASSCLNQAFRALKEIKGAGNILILTDLARGDWESLDLSKTERVSAEMGITFLRIGGPQWDSNAAVKEVRLAEGDPVAGGSSRLEATLINYSDAPVSEAISLFIAGMKIDQKKLDLKAGEEGKVSFDVFFEKPGWIDGEVRLAKDFLPLDDSFYFGLKVKDRVKVLIVDGDPKRALKASESYYLVNALGPGRGEESPFLPRVVTEREWEGLDLRTFDALFLLNVSKPQGSRIASFLESGKPVFIFAGDQMIPGEYNRIPLFPWRLREIQEKDRLKPQQIGQIDFQHEALKDFVPSRGESLKSAWFRRYLQIEGGGKNLLTLENGAPLLAQADFGRGKLYLFASSADLDWNDFPLKAGFLPLFQSLLKEAAGIGKDSSPQSVPYGIKAEEKVPPAQVRGDLGGLGVYKFFLGADESWHGVNLPLEESNLAKMTDGEIERKFGSLPVKVVQFKEGEAAELWGGRKEGWPYLLGFLLAVLIAEMGVAGRI